MLALAVLIIVAGLALWWFLSHQGPYRRYGSDVRWAWGLVAATLPLALIALIVIEALADAMGTTMGLPADEGETRTQELLNYGFFVVVGTPLAASAVMGLRAWRREDDPLGIGAALLSTTVLVAAAAAVVVTWA